MNNRRNLLIALGTTLFVPRTVFAQPKKPPVVIGWLGGGSPDLGMRGLTAFREGLAALGWKEVQQFVIDARWAEGRTERLQPLAEELTAKKPNIIVTTNRLSTLAAANASRDIPIVQATGASPVDVGLATSLARPGGMVTGLTSLVGELSAKYLELLLAASPKVKRVGFLLDRRSLVYAAHMKNARSAIAKYRVDARFAEVAKAEEIEPALERLAKEGVQGLIIFSASGLSSGEWRQIVKLALAQGWPVLAPPAAVEVGALMSYTADGIALQRRAAYYVDRILKGTKPADLPIEQPMTFELVVNLKTAKALGLTMPPEIMVQATQVIQ